MPRMLVVLSREYYSSINTDTIKASIQTEVPIEILKNSLPKGDGIALFECGDLSNVMSWPDYTVKIGDCQTGRYNFDNEYPIIDNPAATIVDIWATLSEEGGDNE